MHMPPAHQWVISLGEIVNNDIFSFHHVDIPIPMVSINNEVLKGILSSACPISNFNNSYTILNKGKHHIFIKLNNYIT